jgi:hypothetical protein
MRRAPTREGGEGGLPRLLLFEAGAEGEDAIGKVHLPQACHHEALPVALVWMVAY